MTLKVDARVNQISTGWGAWVNVLSGMDEGGVGIWGNCHNTPTYLLVRSDTWLLVTFDDGTWRDDKLADLIRTWAADEVYMLPTMEKLRI